MDNAHYKQTLYYKQCPLEKNLKKVIKFQNFVEKCSNVYKIKPCKV